MAAEEVSRSAADGAREVLKGYLGKRFRVEVSDGRIVEGSFICTDKARNIVLSNCEEFYGRDELEKVEGSGPGSGLDRSRRTLGMAIVPGEHIVSISMATNTAVVATETSSTTTETSTGSLTAIDSTQDVNPSSSTS